MRFNVYLNKENEPGLFSFESDVSPIVGQHMYIHDYIGIKRDNPDVAIGKEGTGKFKVVRVDYSINNYTNKYDLKSSCDVIIERVKS